MNSHFLATVTKHDTMLIQAPTRTAAMIEALNVRAELSDTLAAFRAAAAEAGDDEAVELVDAALTTLDDEAVEAAVESMLQGDPERVIDVSEEIEALTAAAEAWACTDTDDGEAGRALVSDLYDAARAARRAGVSEVDIKSFLGIAAEALES